MYAPILRRLAGIILPAFALLVLSAPLHAQTTAATTPAAVTAPVKSVLTPAQQDQVSSLIHDYIVNHPDVLIDSLNAYQHKQEEESDAEHQKNIVKFNAFLTSPTTPFAGNPHGSKVIVEFFDYNCPYCKRALEDVTTLIKDDPEVKVYLKDFPILSSTSMDAARWALAAQKQGKYFEFHVAMMKTPTPGERSTEDMYVKIAKDLGLDVDKMRADAKSQEIQDTIQHNINVAQELGIRGTPGFIIRGKLYDGYVGLKNMKSILAGQPLAQQE